MNEFFAAGQAVKRLKMILFYMCMHMQAVAGLPGGRKQDAMSVLRTREHWQARAIQCD